MLLKDYKEWKDKMQSNQESLAQSRMLPGKIEPGMIVSDNKTDVTSFAEHSVVFLRSKGPNGLYYNANIIVSIKDSYQRELDGAISDRDYWRSRCEDVQTNYNLQERNVQRATETIRDRDERIRILSEALTRSKSKEKGNKIYVSRLKNQFAKKR